MKPVVLDSYAIIAFFERQPGYVEVAKILGECAENEGTIFVSVVNWGEVIYHALRTGGERKAKSAEEAMSAIPITVVEADKEVTRLAAHLKATRKMSYADCFAAGLAMKCKCELVTGDEEFRQVEKEVKIRWLS